MNTIGYMSGMQEFDDESAASEAGISLSREADYALQQYWYQEASPAQKAFYLDLKEKISNGELPDWESERQTLFDNADVNKDGELDQTEGNVFYTAVRAIDGKAAASAASEEKLLRTWNVASQLNEPYDRMSFDDYRNLEKLMEVFYE